MKRRTVILKRILPCIAALLVLANCKNLFQPPEPPPAQATEGTFSLKIGGIRAGRTILPATVQNDFAAYTLVFQADGQTDVSADRTNANLGEAITLNAGTWNLTVTAFMDSAKNKPAADGSITGITISGGGSTSGSLELKPIIEAGATGTFRWNIDYPTDVTLASMAITPLDPETGTEAQTLYFVGGTPLTDKNTYPASSSPLALKTGYYRVVFNLSKGTIETGMEEYLHIYKNLESRFGYDFTDDYFTVYSVVSGADSGPGSLRYAIANAVANSTILVEVETINLESRLVIDKNLTIRGNGVTLTRSAAWTATSATSQLLYISGVYITVNISRVHFKNGRATNNGAAVYNSGTVNLESCIFSGNQTSASNAEGGAIYTYGTMSVKGCTFYNNSTAYRGGAICQIGGTLTLTGNLFYGNTAAANGGPVVYRSGGTVTSSGYNVADVALGTGSTQSGWTEADTDTTITAGTLPVSWVSFKPFSGSEAGAVITTLPTDYPAMDFYGAAIADGAAAGAVQGAASGFVLDLSVNNSSLGSISSTATPDADGLVPDGTAVTITASPADDCELVNWLVNGIPAGSTNQLTRTIGGHTTVQAVFSKGVTVTDFTDTADSETTPGTLRYALTNAQDGYIIRFTGVTAGTTTIELGRALPQVTKSVTLEGNGVTLTRSAAWTSSIYPQLLYINDGSITSAITVNISRVHFKNGNATNGGAAVYNYGETVNLESCIFSGNRTSGSTAQGGAVYNTGTMSVKGCTFYNNGAYRGGAIYNNSGTLTLTGNLFYGNTATNVYPVVAGATSNGYNVADVPMGTGTTQSGWTSVSTDKTITAGTLPVGPVSFRLITGRGAANVIPTLPDDYPQKDFYGDAIANGAAAGAVQDTATGFFLELSVNNSSRGSVSYTPAPDADGLIPAGTVTLTASPTADHFLDSWLVDGVNTSGSSPFDLTISEHTVVQAVFGRHPLQVTDFTDTANSETTQGTLRYALTNAQDGDIIRFTGVTAGTTTIALGSALPPVIKSVTIEGNGVTLTRSAAWIETTDTSQLLYIYTSSAYITVNISRVHFKNGRATNYGAALKNDGETVNLESCIFSGNHTSGGTAYGGAIYNKGNMSVKGCTFYNNSSTNTGGAIYNGYPSTLTTFTGNLFYGNTAGYANPVVSKESGSVPSNGYNATDVDLGTGTTQSGWTSVSTDKTITAGTLPVSPLSFRLITGSGAASVIPSLPADYPQTDFYGVTIADGAAAGAVQNTAGNGYFLELKGNSRGSVSSTPAPNGDGMVSAGTVTLTANPAAGHFLIYWLIDGVKTTGSSPLNLPISDHTVVEAVFGIQVTNFSDASGSDTTLGTLRYALTNGPDEDVIRFTGVTAGTTTIELGSALPQVTRSITIEGNGVTLTPGAGWTSNASSQLLRIYNSDAAITVNINRVHFKDGRATTGAGAAVYNNGETVNLESCIFSGNQTSANNGGAISSNSGTMSVKGCTFYANRTQGSGRAIFVSSGTLTLTGNLFYGNTVGTNGGPAVYCYGATVTSNGYNVVDVNPLVENTPSGWTAGTGDTTFSALSITGEPFNTTTFAPVTGLNGVLPSTAPEGFPAADFNGATRTWPGAPGAVK